MIAVSLLFLAKIFLMIAWYSHLKFPDLAMWQAALISWGFAFFEYSLAIPAIRMGEKQFSLPEIQVMQFLFLMIAFLGFSVFMFQVKLNHNHLIGFALMFIGAALVYNANTS